MSAGDVPELLITPCHNCEEFGLVCAIKRRPDGELRVHLECGHVVDGEALQPPESFDSPEVGDG